MTDLDNPETYQRYDPGGMLLHLHKLPQQCREAWEKAEAYELPCAFKDIDKVVVCGMGGSAIGGDLLSSLAANLGKPIVFVHRGYDLPAFVDSQTLVIASSYSGNTEETLSAFAQAMERNCTKFVITTGGRLRELAQENGIPVFIIDYHSQPRAALGYSFVPLLSLLGKLGLLEDQLANVEAMLQELEGLLDKLAENIPESHNPAKQLARSLFGKLIIIYGAGILAPVAKRWKGQFNENSKALAFYETFPELNHNAVVGYEFPREVAGNTYVILLHSPSLHPRILARYRVTGEILEKAGLEYKIVTALGSDDLTRMMSHVFLGDWVSYYLAMIHETDPTPVRMIDYLKQRLGQIR